MGGTGLTLSSRIGFCSNIRIEMAMDDALEILLEKSRLV